jgi:plastocyanin
MNITLRAVTVAAIAAASSSLFAGEITGKVTLTGTPSQPEVEITPIKADKNCGPLHDKPVMTRRYVVGADNGLANVWVYIKDGLPAGKTYEAPKDKPVVDQTGCMYEPYVSGVMAGQPFVVKNSDPFMHNVNAQSKENPGFNIAQANQGQQNEKTFAKPETVKLICNVHTWMTGYLRVFENPFFAVTDKDGKFTISGDLPDGKYTVEAEHLKSGKVTGEVEVKGGKATLSLSLAAK